ncbi:hypothetical protein V5799_017021 [Amblyomma americanum]|uniref:Secreted protein n=1 Tax=Amblyomma americanum TaxID=6943 RepID=A0AAQ4F3F2_AMBAM
MHLSYHLLKQSKFRIEFGLRSSDTSRSSSSQRWLKSRSVVPVYLRCDQGRVTWKYPRGALRVLLRLGGTGSGGSPRDFRACVKIDANSTGAAVHLEGHRRLIPIFKDPEVSNNDINKALPEKMCLVTLQQGQSRGVSEEDGEVRRCFTSYGGQVALFLEATPEANHLLSRDTFRLWYHLTPVMSQRDLDDDLAECRPCTDRELLHHYCSSDFVAEGVVTSLRHLHRRDVTEITVAAARVHRDSSEEPAFLPGSNRKMAAVLQRPLKCGTRAGRGHFMFIGVRMLGKPTLRCAPRLQYWRKLRDRAIRDGTSMCTLL